MAQKWELKYPHEGNLEPHLTRSSLLMPPMLKGGAGQPFSPILRVYLHKKEQSKVTMAIRQRLLPFVALMALLPASCSRSESGESSKGNPGSAPYIELAPSHEDCRGLPTQERSEAFGFELGSCLADTLKRAEHLGLELKLDRGPNTPKNIFPYVIVDYPPVNSFDAPREKFTQLVFDDKGRLFAVRANYLYKKKYHEAKSAFTALDGYLTSRFGDAEIDPFTKIWQTGSLYVDLKFQVDMKSDSVISVSFFQKDLSQKAIGFPGVSIVEPQPKFTK